MMYEFDANVNEVIVPKGTNDFCPWFQTFKFFSLNSEEIANVIELKKPKCLFLKSL